MESIPDDAPLVVILGPTASGKTALALELARRFDGEIIAADSRTVYRGMDIGTAKPTAAERAEISHHLIDIVNPDERFTVADFQVLAKAAIAHIGARGKLPILVGGSGLYIDAVIYDFSFSGEADLARRRELQDLSVPELQQLLKDKGIALPENSKNVRHLTRALETGGHQAVRRPLRKRTLVLGINPDREVLAMSIAKRVEKMVAEGFVDEVRQLAARYGWNAPALQAPGYKAFAAYLNSKATLQEAKSLFVQKDMQYAKRQKTWFKRNNHIHFISKTAEAVDLATTLLNK